MAKMDFDPIDFLLLSLAFIGAGAMAGIISVNAFDVSLADMAFSGIGNGVTLATLKLWGSSVRRVHRDHSLHAGLDAVIAEYEKLTEAMLTHFENEHDPSWGD